MTQAPAYAVIGAGYGDEGKGLLTDALAHALGRDTVVIRFNGGAQAGHTVTAPDGRRHVFHHVGSGTLAGAATGLSRHFVSNPRILAEECAVLAALGVAPRIAADARGLVTTPWDMMINQLIEEERGTARHGSCGLGVGETVERCLRPAYATTLADLGGEVDALRARFDAIRRDWVPERLTRLGMPRLWLRNRDLFLAPGMLDRAIADARAVNGHLDIVPCLTRPPGAALVFEAAQGLMLDQTIGAFPFVTRSNTGLRNIADIAGDIGLARLEAVYATRAYVTRHGAGPLAHEQGGPPSPLFEDRTNLPNPWQGSLRFGHLDLDVLEAAIQADRASIAERPLVVVPRLAVTCVDQLRVTGVTWVEAGATRTGSAEALLSAAGSRLPVAGDPLVCAGPERHALSGLDGLLAAA